GRADNDVYTAARAGSFGYHLCVRKVKGIAESLILRQADGGWTKEVSERRDCHNRNASGGKEPERASIDKQLIEQGNYCSTLRETHNTDQRPFHARDGQHDHC